jgi:hypothetical protein
MQKTIIENHIQNFRYTYLKNLVCKSDDFWNTITNIKIISHYNKISDIKISYTHSAEHYSINDYCLNEDSETEESDTFVNKETRIEFGYHDRRFFINGKTPIRVYSKRDALHIPYAYSSTYEHELDEPNQALLLDKYLNNKNIPEWLVIGFFKALRLEYANIDNMADFLQFK